MSKLYNVRVWTGSRFVDYKLPHLKDHLLKVPREWFAIFKDFGQVLCDACGEVITDVDKEDAPRFVWLLVLSKPWVAWGTICEECRWRYHSERPAYAIK